MSVAARNALLFNRVTRLGQLDGLPAESLLRLRGIGPKTATEIVTALARLGRVPPKAHARSAELRDTALAPALATLPMTTLRFGLIVLSGLEVRGVTTLAKLMSLREHERFGLPRLANLLHDELSRPRSAGQADGVIGLRNAIYARPDAAGLLQVSDDLWNYPVEWLSPNEGSIRLLTRSGGSVIGDLDGLASDDLATITRMSPGAAESMIGAIRQLGSLPYDKLSRLAFVAEGRSHLPKVSPQVLNAVASATTLNEEIRGLVSDVSPRNAGALLSRWGLTEWPPPTLEQIGTGLKITRERVRQVVTAHELRLRESGLRLPIASAVIAVLESRGGALSTSQLLAATAEAGVQVDANSLRAMPSLSELKLLDPLQHSDDFDLWLSAKGATSWHSVGGLAETLAELLRQVGKDLRATSCVEEDNLKTPAAFGSQDALLVRLGRRAELLQVAGHLIPLPIRTSRLTRSAEKVLAVARSIPLWDLYNGLRRRLRNRTPPQDVVEVILARHPSFAIKDGVVRSSGRKVRRTVLSPAERVAVDLIRSHDGVMLWTEFIDEMKGAGFSVPTATIILKAPFMRSPTTGIYGLRGSKIDSSALEAKRRQRTAARSTSGTILSARWLSADRFEVRYRLTRFSLAGVLPQPPKFKAPAREWRGRLPDGRSVTIKIAHGFIWSLHKWLKQIRAVEGDVVVASFSPAELVIEFEHVPQGV